MKYDITDKDAFLSDFLESCGNNISREKLGELYKKPVAELEIRPLGLRDDNNVGYFEVVLNRGQNDAKTKMDKRFWKVCFDWGAAPNRSGYIFRNPFTEKNEHQYLQYLSANEGFVPSFDWPYSFPNIKTGKTIRILSMEKKDADLLDFITPYCNKLSELRKQAGKDRCSGSSYDSEIKHLEKKIMKIFKIAINVNAYNDILISLADPDKNENMLKRISRLDISNYRFELENFVNAISGTMFSDSFVTGLRWYDDIGAKMFSCLTKSVAEPLAAYPELERAHHIRFHPEHVLISGNVKEEFLENINPENIEVLIADLIAKEHKISQQTNLFSREDWLKGDDAFSIYGNFSVADYRVMKAPTAFSYSKFINYMPISDLEIGLTNEMRQELLEHAIFVDYSLRRKKVCKIDRAPLSDEVPTHMKQADAATIFNLLLDTYVLTMNYTNGRVETDRFKRLMYKRLSRINEVKGEHNSFGIVGQALDSMFNLTFPNLRNKEEVNKRTKID
ncbi:MAG: hypothetical protein Q8O89_08125 [Nanoarchaeota archaeon]|nr:hypothetical protein [Nanoarchaeota archaeon]